ncbi:MAG: hypothetical protein V3U79_05670 [Dehalococcoidia bacterium]
MFIRAFRHEAQYLKPPRTLVTPHLLGRTIGPARDIVRQRQVVLSALRLLEGAQEPGAILDFSPA